MAVKIPAHIRLNKIIPSPAGNAGLPVAAKADITPSIISSGSPLIPALFPSALATAK
jgi:hypothetical protein